MRFSSHSAALQEAGGLEAQERFFRFSLPGLTPRCELRGPGLEDGRFRVGLSKTGRGHDQLGAAGADRLFSLLTCLRVEAEISPFGGALIFPVKLQKKKKRDKD